MAYLPERRLEPPRPPEPDCICSACLGELYGDEEVYRFDGRILCGDCLREEIEDLSIRELAELIDADRFTAEEIRDERRENP